MCSPAFILTAALYVSVLSVGVCRDVPRGQPPALKPRSDSRKPAFPTAASPQSPQHVSFHNASSKVVLVVLPSTANASDFNGAAVPPSRLHKQRLIRGSKKAATITKKEYLKKDWCKTEPFQQIIHEPGCQRKRFMNKFCYGQCNSFFIPKSDSEDQDGGSFRSCAYCTPVSSEWVEVMLVCPSLSPPRRVKRVQVVTACKCMAVSIDAGLARLDQ